MSPSQQPTTDTVSINRARVNSQLKQYLQNCLEKMFADAEDKFFDLATQAKDNRQQTQFLDGLKEVNNQKMLLRQQMLQLLQRWLQDPTKVPPHHQRQQFKQDDSLSLVDHEALEKSIALTTFITRIRADFAGPLLALNSRLNELYPQLSISLLNNPLDPAQICHAFELTSDPMVLDIECRLVIYREFGEQLCQSIGNLYQQVNDDLIKQGVLPDLKVQRGRQTQQTSRTQRPAPNPIPATENNANSDGHTGTTNTNADPNHTEGDIATKAVHNRSETSAGGISDSGISQNRLATASNRGHGTSSQNQHPATPVVRAVPSPATTTRVKVQASDAVTSASSLVVEISFADLRTLLGSPQSTPADNSPVVPTSPNEASRTTTPLSHQQLIHVLDDLSHTLTQATNPSSAQQAINVTEAIRQQTDLPLHASDSDAIAIVEMLFSFVLDDKNLPSPIQAQLAKLQLPMLKVALQDQTLFQSHKHPARLLLNKMAYAAIGWDQSVNSGDLLERQITHTVERIISAQQHTPTLFDGLLREFAQFHQANEKRALLIEKRVCQESSGQARLQTAQEHVNDRLTSLCSGLKLPTLIIELLDGPWKQVLVQAELRKNGQDNHHQEAWQFVSDLLWSMQSHAQELARERLIKVAARLQKQLKFHLQQIGIDEANIATQRKGLFTLHHHVLAGNFPRSSDQLDYFRPADKEDNSTDQTVSSSANGRSRFDQLVNDLQVGTWLELQQDEEEPLRCKLAAIINATDTLVLVNRLGVKVCNIGKSQLAWMMQRQKARLIEQTPLFDRALQQVSHKLRTQAHTRPRLRSVPESGHVA